MFVDAGYLITSAGALLLGAKNRQEIACDYGALVRGLIEHAEGRCGNDILRLYWYDGAPEAVPLPHHQRIAALPYVKLRLGRVVGPKDNRRQKGVDSLIVRDLIVLATERAVSTAYLLAGDEDLREGVSTSQEKGLQVSLLGIPPTGQLANQAESLIREADEHFVFTADFLRPFFSRPAAPEMLLAAADLLAKTPRAIGEAFAAKWAARTTPEELDRLLSAYPTIPTELHAQLIREAEQHLGNLRGREPEKRDLRAAFWQTIRQRVEQGSPVADETGDVAKM